MITDEKEAVRRNARVLDLLRYRVPMMVTELEIYCNGNGYYVCPQCHVTLEREFSAYCDRCGQCLNWKGYKNVSISDGTVTEHK